MLHFGRRILFAARRLALVRAGAYVLRGGLGKLLVMIWVHFTLHVDYIITWLLLLFIILKITTLLWRNLCLVLLL